MKGLALILSLIVHIYHVPGEGGLSFRELRQELHKVDRRYKKEFHVDLKFKFKRYKENPIQREETLEGFYDFYYLWKGLISPRKARRLYLVVLPPIRSDNKYFMGGLSALGCGLRKNKDPFGIVYAAPLTVNGLDRKRHSKIVMIHELAHQMSAYHTGSPDIMNTMIGSLVDKIPGRIKFALQSKREIRECLGNDILLVNH